MLAAIKGRMGTVCEWEPNGALRARIADKCARPVYAKVDKPRYDNVIGPTFLSQHRDPFS